MQPGDSLSFELGVSSLIAIGKVLRLRQYFFIQMEGFRQSGIYIALSSSVCK